MEGSSASNQQEIGELDESPQETHWAVEWVDQVRT